jgi:hypothetical protein
MELESPFETGLPARYLDQHSCMDAATLCYITWPP